MCYRKSRELVSLQAQLQIFPFPENLLSLCVPKENRFHNLIIQMKLQL